MLDGYLSKCMAQKPAAATDEPNPTDLVERLVEAGPEDGRTIIPEAQAEALVLRDLLGRSRPETADTLDISVYTVDTRLRRARQNVEAVAATARVLLDVGLLTAEDLGLAAATAGDEPAETGVDDAPEPRRLRVGLTSAVTPRDEQVRQNAQDATRATASEDTAEAPAEVSDGVASAWGRLLAIDAVTKVTRSADGSSASITLKDATDDDVETVRAVLDDLGLVEWGSDTFGSSGVATIRGRAPAEDDVDQDDVEDEPEPTEAEIAAAHGDEDARTCHYCGEAFVIGEDAPEIVGVWNQNAEHPACVDCIVEVLTRGASLTPLPEFRDGEGEDATLDADDVEQAESAAQSETSDDEGAEPTDDDEDDESEGYACEDCGRVFDTGAGLGGHRKYCEARADRRAAEADAE